MTATTPGTILSRALAHAPSANVLKAAAVLCAAALTAAAAQFTVTLPFTAVPVTLQPTVVLLTAAALGPRLGAAAQVTYLLAGIAGLPVWAASAALAPGAARLVGPTAGYLLSYPVAAWITGAVARRGWDRRYVSAVAAMTLGLLVIFACGVSWIVLVFSQPPATAMAAGFYPFFLLDLAKISVAAALLPLTARVLSSR